MSAYEVYISVDVETTGRIPGIGESSMVQVGAVVCAKRVAGSFSQIPNGSRFEANLKQMADAPGEPDTIRWLREQGLDPNDGQLPLLAMERFLEWTQLVTSQYPGAKLVYVGYPLGFDWSFTHWYFEHFLGTRSDPFGFSNALDIKSMYAAKAGVGCFKSIKSKMRPKSLARVDHPHTHNALDDAIGQGELFCNIIEWGGPDA